MYAPTSIPARAAGPRGPGLPSHARSRAMLKTLSIEELIPLARAGDKSALGELLSRYQEKIEEWSTHYLPQGQPGGVRPSDIVQDTAERVASRFHEFRGGTGAELTAWLQQVCRSRAVQSVRGAFRQKRAAAGVESLDSPEALAAPSPQKSPSQVTSLRQEGRQVLIYLSELPDEQREAIRLCRLEGWRVAEVSRHMGKTEPAVAGLLQRGLKTLSARMAGGPEADAASTWSEVEAALLDYLKRHDAGEQLDRATFLAEHPACADELSELLEWLERVLVAKHHRH
jgi:RNA polymerase sigma-70 factor, ECF subfamily